MATEMNYSSLEKMLIENCQAGTFITNLDGKLIDCNQSFATIFGYESIEEILNVNAISFYSNKLDREIYLKELENNKKVRNYVVKAYKKDGDILYHSINSDLYQDTDGQVLVVGSILDVTESLISKIELKDSEKRYRDMFENSMEIIQSFDKTGKLNFCNSAWHEKLGYSKDDVKSLNLFDIIADEYKPHCSLMFQEVIAGNSIKDVEVEFVTKSGKRLFLEGNIVPMLVNNELKATHGFFRDITEKSLAKRKLAEQEKLLQTIFNTVPICLYIKDDQGKYIHSNEQMNNTMGCDVSGKIDTDLFPASNTLQLNRTDRQAIENPNNTIKYEIDLHDVQEGRSFFCGKKAIYNESKNKYDLFGFSVDITELKKNSKKIEENEKFLEYVLSNIDGGFLIFTKNKMDDLFLLKYKNSYADQLFGKIEDKIHLHNFTQLIAPELDSKLSESFAEGMNSLSYEWHKKTETNNSSEYYSVRFNRIPNDDSNVIVNIQNITEEKNLIHELEKNLKANAILIGEVHHRVKNNLAIIDGILELKKHKIEDTNFQKNITDIQSRIKSIALVHEKLYQSGNFASIRIKEYIIELSNHYKKIFDSEKSKQIQFNFNIAEDFALGMSKSISFGLLLSELISNSCKYGLTDNKVDITIELAQQTKGGNFSLLYYDSGKNWNSQIKNLKQGGFGFRLIANLTKQLKAEYQIFESENFKFQLHFQP